MLKVNLEPSGGRPYIEPWEIKAELPIQRRRHMLDRRRATSALGPCHSASGARCRAGIASRAHPHGLCSPASKYYITTLRFRSIRRPGSALDQDHDDVSFAH